MVSSGKNAGRAHSVLIQRNTVGRGQSKRGRRGYGECGLERASKTHKLRLFKMAFRRARRRETTRGGTYQASLDPLASITCEPKATKDAQNGQHSHPPNPGAPRRAFSRARPQRAWRLRTPELLRRSIKQDVQNGLPARPQVSQNRRRTLPGTLRILTRRERSEKPFSTSVTPSKRFCRRTCGRASAPAPPSPPAADTCGR